MNSKEFQRVFDEQIILCENVLMSKSEEYASDKDKLHNFKAAAATTGETPVEALAGMMVKHTISIYDMIREHSSQQPSKAKWDEKLTDHINYLILLRALLFENYVKNEDIFLIPEQYREQFMSEAYSSFETENIVKGDT